MGAQGLAAQLECCGFHEMVDEHELVRYLEIGQPLGTNPFLQFHRTGLLATGNDEGAAAFAQILVGYRHHRGIVDLRVGHQVVLDFLGRNLFAGPVDVVPGPALHDQVPGRQSPHDVAGAVVAVGGEGTFVGGRVVVVGAQRVGAAGGQVAGFAIGDGAVIVVHDADLVIRADGPALGFDDGVFVVVEPRVVDQPLGHAEDLLQRHPQHRPYPPCHFRNQLGPPHLDHLQAGEVGLRVRRRLQPQQQQRGHQRRVGDAFPFDQVEADSRRGRRCQHHPACGIQRAQKAR